MLKIVPSIASADLLNIQREVKKAERTGRLHFDMEDGNFSPDITFGVDLAGQISAVTDARIDAHLMVNNPLKYIVPLMDCGVTSIAFHLEAAEYPSECLTVIHSCGGKAGMALNYGTKVSDVEPWLDQIDYLLLQTCEAGDPTLAFKPYSLKKIRQARELVGLDGGIELWADGGIRKEMLPELERCGLDYAVMGRAFFEADEFAEDRCAADDSAGEGGAG